MDLWIPLMWRFSLATKLALFLSALSLALVLAILLLFKISFDRGFEHYINQTIAERMEHLAVELAQDPERFKQLLGNQRLWDRYLRNYLRDPGGASEASHPVNETARGATPRRELARWGVVRRSVWLLDVKQQYPLQNGFRGDEPNRAIHAPADIDQLKLLPIFAQGEQLGFLAWRPIKPRDSALDAHFSERQHRLFIWIAFGAVATGALLAWPLSRYLVNPVRRLSLAMGALMQRDYAQRVPVSSRDELSDLARDFNLMAQTLEEQDSQQRQWLADISHELRTPLGVMKGELEAVEDGLLPLDESRVHSLGEEVNQLTRLVDDLHQLAITQVSHLRYEWHTLELNEFLVQMSARLAPLLQQAKLAWVLDLPPEIILIRADSQRLEQLIMNLAQNSIRYTDRGGAVRVTLRGGSLIQLIWEDSSPGVAEKDLMHLFDRFYRVEHSRQRALGGSGLGLAIVANIAEAHGAKLNAEASPLGGLKITVSFNPAEKQLF
jgi:two-component system sensor histidine kinase BaeS